MTKERRYFTLNNPDQTATQGAPGTGGRLRRILWILLVLVALIAALCLIFPRLMNTDRVVRFFRYMGLRDKASYGRLEFDSGAGNVYAGFDDGLLVGTDNGVTL